MSRPPLFLHRWSRVLAGRARGTDWWMVGIEIGIVVLGILIAFQLDRWGDRITQRQEERRLLERIVAEARASVRALDFIIVGHRESADNYRLLALAADEHAAAQRYPLSGRDGCNLLRVPAVQRPASGAIALAAGQRGEVIADTRLRQLLAGTVAAREFGDAQLDYFRANFLNYGRSIEPHMRWRFTGLGTEAECQVDVAAMTADKAATALFPKLARDQLRLADYRAVERDSLLQLTARAACLLESTCKPE